MHLLLREHHGLDAQDMAEDLAHRPAPLLLMSFSDSDLLGLQDAEMRRSASLQKEGCSGFDVASGEGGLQVVNLQRLRHPMSVDLYLEQTAAQAQVIVVRLLGGAEYWRYGVEELSALSRSHNISLILLPGACESPDALKKASRVDAAIWDRFNGFFREGGARNWSAALHLMRAMVNLEEDDHAVPHVLPPCGVYRSLAAKTSAHRDATIKLRTAWVIFYRAHLAAGDLSGIDATLQALAISGCNVRGLYVSTLKNEEIELWLKQEMRASKPDIILNATFFSARRESDTSKLTSTVLDGAGVPVIQLLQPGATRQQWNAAARGLSQTDIAMQVALPELDGRLCGTAISFKGEVQAGLPARRVAADDGIAQVVTMAQGWMRLAATPRNRRRLALILSDYPGAEGQMAHAVGLDGFASLSSILDLLKGCGYHATSMPPAQIAKALQHNDPVEVMTAEAYRTAFESLPDFVRASVVAQWGPPNDAIHVRFKRYGAVVVAIQPRRGRDETLKSDYHSIAVAPGHQYLGFYLWLARVEAPHAMIHLGTHGTLEWLPGKAVALSEVCFPWVLSAGVPIIYPFIVNNPGEAATAKRRLAAVTLGHLTPPMCKAGLEPRLASLERLIDEYAEADGMDPRRRQILQQEIVQHAKDCGLWDEFRLSHARCDEDAMLATLDAQLCDIKDLQIREGLHIFGQRAPSFERLAQAISESCQTPVATVEDLLSVCPQAEAKALIAALDGQFISPGPAGAPTRGRLDVLPTGRNLTTLDPRHLPTRAAYTLARRGADDILLRHLQEEGRPLRQLIMDVWGSATFRTGGEDIALAFALMGVTLNWSTENGRLDGFEIIPLAILDRPRVDVTLRISGMFRDAFPGLIALMNQVVAALAAREEPADWNPLATERAAKRVFGTAPHAYGTGVEDALAQLDGMKREEIGARFIAGSSWAYHADDAAQDEAAFRAQLRKSECLLHVQDHAETDLLDSPDWATHEGGLSAAAFVEGARPKSWHGDTSDGTILRLRAIEDEIARVTRGRLTNPVWLSAMQNHDYRGAAEIARSVAALCGFAMTLPMRFDAQFDRVFAVTLADESCNHFLLTVNPDAREDIRRRLEVMWREGKWVPRQNSAAAILRP